MNLSKKDKILLFCVLGLVLGYFYIQFFLMGIIDKISNTGSDILSNQSKLNKIEKLQVDNKIKQVKLNDIQMQYNNKINSLPISARVPDIMNELKSLADSNQVSINNVTFQDGQEAAKVSEISNFFGKDDSKNKAYLDNLMVVPSNVSLSGDYGKIINFINQIESNARIAKVSNINLSLNREAQKVQANINVIYLYNNIKSGDNKKPLYDFNNDPSSYGKDDIFK